MIHRILSIPVLISFHFEPRVQANYIRALEGIKGYNINRWMPLILTHDLARHCSLRGTEKKKSFACLRLFRVIIGECDLRWSIHSPWRVAFLRNPARRNTNHRKGRCYLVETRPRHGAEKGKKKENVNCFIHGVCRFFFCWIITPGLDWVMHPPSVPSSQSVKVSKENSKNSLLLFLTVSHQIRDGWRAANLAIREMS